MSSERQAATDFVHALDWLTFHGEEPEQRLIDELEGFLLDRQDRFADALQRTHVALGGDGEWRASPGSTLPAGETGDLSIDVPAMAEALYKAHNV